ncbi:unnamed protein product [Discosporangium mesarthrocarpum]
MVECVCEGPGEDAFYQLLEEGAVAYEPETLSYRTPKVSIHVPHSGRERGLSGSRVPQGKDLCPWVAVGVIGMDTLLTATGQDVMPRARSCQG